MSSSSSSIPAGRCGSFRWLWLTDLHQGQHGQEWLWPTLREEFFKDVTRLHEKSGPWDIVVFTGDLVFSGKTKEFDMLTETLDQLWARLRDLGSDPFLLCIPGNHDLERPEADSAATVALRLGWRDDRVQGAFWEKPDSEYRRLLDQSFRNYINWNDQQKFPRPLD